MPFADNPWSSDRFNFPRKKQRLGISITKRLQPFVPAEKIEVQFREGDFVIEPQPRLQILVGQKLASRFTELLREKIEILLLNGKPCRHFVSAVFVDLVRAPSQCLHEIETFNAAATPFSDAVLIDTDHNRGAMILTCDPRGYDSQNTGMPASVRNHYGRIAFGIELGRDLFFRRGEDLFFNFLSL